MGDSSNNVPGVHGIGKKTAQKLLTTFGSLNGIYKNTDKLKGKQKERIIGNKDNAYLYRKLSALKCDIDLSYDEYFVNYINEDYDLKNNEAMRFLNDLGIS